MSHQSQGEQSAPTPEQLREQVDHTRDELGRTVEALAAKADIKEQAREKAADIKEQAGQKAALAADQLRHTAAQAAETIREKTPAPVLDKAAHVRESVTHTSRLAVAKAGEPLLQMAGTAATRVRANPTPLLAATAAILVVLLLRRGRRQR
ncbi:DUF3618 domain-containing protein [Streptomyces sp. NPDC086023]|uniref:DUF3618 domain-containing protein n=1 Tax=Streptomyces sp. NPDC086023 TaxID=3365746 RepID=UPI0037CDB372